MFVSADDGCRLNVIPGRGRGQCRWCCQTHLAPIIHCGISRWQPSAASTLCGATTPGGTANPKSRKVTIPSIVLVRISLRSSTRSAPGVSIYAACRSVA